MQDSPVIIRKIDASDVVILQHISKQTFNETFSESNNAEDMVIYLEEAFSVEKLRLELDDPNSEFYFSIIDNEVVGYLKINFGESQTELKDNKGLEIERIYVSKEYLGKRIGQMLYDKAIEIARAHQARYVWLGVWEENHRAINFYKKNGFVAFDKHVFKLGNDEQIDIMMRFDLQSL